MLAGRSAFRAVWAQCINHFIFKKVVAIASKQYNSWTDFRVRLALGSPLINQVIVCRAEDALQVFSERLGSAQLIKQA